MLRNQNLNPDKKSHQERLADIKKMKHGHAKDLQRKINNGIRQRDDQVERNLTFLKDENERRKEVKHLHKID